LPVILQKEERIIPHPLRRSKPFGMVFAVSGEFNRGIPAVSFENTAFFRDAVPLWCW
jgi:hypothetical protein